MTVTLDQLEEWMKDPEDEHLEFKEAKNNYHFEELVKYCAALANEGGGRLVLGVTNKRPREVVGTRALPDPNRTKAGLTERLHLRIEADELLHRDRRVLVFTSPSRPIGMPIQYKGAYWMRAGESLVPMTPDMLKAIFAEAGPDFSAEICQGASLSDLDPAAIQRFRNAWVRQSRNDALLSVPHEQLLSDAELLVDGGITYAALALLGTRKALGKHLANAEVTLEYRVNQASTEYDHRRDFREGFFLFMDELWAEINKRNDTQHFHEGLFTRDIATFNEDVVREAILNAVSHRDYRLAGAVFLRQYPRRLEIESPGGFPAGITTENILERHLARNKCIAEALVRCGLGKRSGWGVRTMFKESIKEGKSRPDFSGTDDHRVVVTLHGEVQDARFIQFLERVGSETLSHFDTPDFLVLDLVHREEKVPDSLRDSLHKLAELGVIEIVGRGRGTRYILSRRFYRHIGEKGVYTRKKGLDRETNKELLLKHIRENAKEGSQLRDLKQVLPTLSQGRIQTLLREMRAEGRIHSIGRTNAGRWYPTADPAAITSEKN